jgi:hypothetical protein
MSKHTIEEREADIKRARHEAQHQRELSSVELTPEQVRLRRIIQRNLAQRRQELRAKREAQEYHEHARRFNCLGDIFTKASLPDFV